MGLDNYLKVTKYEYKLKNKKINIKIFSDLHFSSSFNLNKLSKIEKFLTKDKTDYILIPGDLIDTTKVLDIDEFNELYNWLDKLSQKYIVILSLGNHDISYKEKGKWQSDNENKIINSFKNTNVKILTNNIYEDEFVYIYGAFLPFSYYKNESRKENKKELIASLKKNKEKLISLNKDKVNIFMCHSPIYLSHIEVLSYLKEFDFLISGHMHNGMFLPNIKLPGNIGLVGPHKMLFPKNARGEKILHIFDREIILIISGGITKIQECAGFLQIGNIFYSMQADVINLAK